jgi:hypothetical protein
VIEVCRCFALKKGIEFLLESEHGGIKTVPTLLKRQALQLLSSIVARTVEY